MNSIKIRLTRPGVLRNTDEKASARYINDLVAEAIKNCSPEKSPKKFAEEYIDEMSPKIAEHICSESLDPKYEIVEDYSANVDLDTTTAGSSDLSWKMTFTLVSEIYILLDTLAVPQGGFVAVCYPESGRNQEIKMIPLETFNIRIASSLK